ncbi:Tetratricopeptide repeat-containing protein [Marinobacter daqiaonensis]|uniref:Tetratricopeptide repeat-containing protein n=1 Tax=Marinobacter daqiaonensis TaxID=650891 RepID=A0A1I6GER2_9GAMM|nr:tetratricopeptide repeat-containing response regulator [Marinobacter daqiaonensis]SFR40695.1 Tetratricopeptide repeat-containing protein [Marinobacter daqiaonensis]
MTDQSGSHDYGPSLRKLRFLVVDDFENFRNSMRQMLRSLGAEKIELVHNGSAAVQRCTYDHFDVLLCNYNLGEGKSGQHVLEELRHRKLLHHSSLFLMVTAETSREMVMGAREYHPDAYLTKPINRAMLEKRLGALAERREALLPITRAMDLEDYPEAIQQCLALLPKHRRHRTWIYKTLADLYFRVGDLGQARKIYDEVLSQRSLSWARLGKARVMLAEGYHGEVTSDLQQLIEDHPDYLEAYDLMAESLKRTGKPGQAQKILLKAAELSPNALLRQRDLATLATQNQDIDTAAEAWRRAVTLGTWSVHDSPEHHLALGRSLSDLSEADPTGEGREQADEALRILKQLERKFPEAPDIGARSMLVRSRIQAARGDRETAQKYLEEARSALPEDKLTADSGLDLAKSLYRLGNNQEAERLLSSLAQKFESEPEVLEQIETLMDEPVGLQQRLQARTLNREGIQAYEKGALGEAAGHFEKALDIVPNHAALNLNLVQIRMKQMDEGDTQVVRQHALAQCRRCLQALENLPPQHRQYRRYLALRRKLEHIE